MAMINRPRNPHRANRWIVIGAVLALAMACAFAAASFFVPGWGGAPDRVRIGVGQPLTGNLSALGQDMLNGARMAADEINAAGGVRLGSRRVPLEIVPADDRSSPAEGQAAARSLVASGVVAALAHLNSGVSIAAAPIYAEAHVPQLAISTKPEYTQLGLPTTLRIVANDDLQSRAMGVYAAQLPGARHFAVIDDATPYGKGLADLVSSVMKENGARIDVRTSLDDKVVEFGALLPVLREASVDVIVTTLSDFQVVALVRQLAAAGLANIQVLGGDTLKTDRMLAAAGLAKAVYSTTPIISPQEFPNGKIFLKKFRDRFHGDPVYGAHYAYDAVYLVVDAVERNGSLDRRELLERLKSFDGNAPVTGSMRFRQDGEQRYGAIGVYQMKGRDWALSMRSDRW